MSKTLLVLRNEIVTTLTRRSFLLATFGLPLVGALVLLGASALNRSSPDVITALTSAPDVSEQQTEGYVDRSGIIESLPANLPEGRIVPYPTDAAAGQALAAGEISGYYVVPADYVDSGKLVYICPDPRPFASAAQAGPMSWALLVNLLDGDIELARGVWNPMDLQVTSLAPEPRRPSDDVLVRSIPHVTMLLFYSVILMASSLLLNAVGTEKKNRVMEILLLSLSPRQMLVGKITGLGIIGLIQTGAWLGIGYAALRIGGRTFDWPAGIEPPVSVMAWGFVFFLLGYAVYASLMAGVGVLVRDWQEASQATFVVIMPLLAAYAIMGYLTDYRHGVLAAGLSLFPLTAPIVMTMRLAAGDVPLWQLLLASGLMLVTAILIMRAVARMFHAQNLLSGQPFSFRRLFAALLGRE